jgi:hypothetical protein
MSYEKIAKMLVVLKERTDVGDLPWSETEEGGVFQSSFSNYSVRILREQNPFEQDEIDIVLQIINDKGDVVEQVRDPDLAQWFQKPFIFMRDLYESARRRAMGVDDAIDEIMRSLQGPNF